ncbi:serine/threonine-protein kinase/endoribonuclease IRE1 [Tanacetum coccineum]
MSKGTHNPSPAKTLLLKGQFNNLKIPGTHKEVWDLLHKLHAVHPEHWPIQSPARLCKHINFWSASDRLRYFQDLSSYLEDTVPRPEPLITALKNLTVVTHGNPFSDWSTKFNKGVVTAMESVPDRSVAQPSDSAEEAQQNLENVPNKSKQPAQEKTRKVNYNYKCPVNLIRFMRNGYTHIHSFTSRKTDGTRTLADDLGSNVIEMEKTFRYLFPDLFVSVYEVVEKHIDSLPHSLKMCYQA